MLALSIHTDDFKKLVESAKKAGYRVVAPVRDVKITQFKLVNSAGEIVLDEMSTALQRIAVIQLAGAEAIEDEDELEALQSLAGQIEPQRLQLFYQIAVTSRRDLGLAL